MRGADLDARRSTARYRPALVLSWREEQARFAFQNGDAPFMRNWPYAWPLIQDSSRRGWPGVSRGADARRRRTSTAALGGWQLAAERASATAEASLGTALVPVEPAQMIERARVAGQLRHGRRYTTVPSSPRPADPVAADPRATPAAVPRR